LSRIQELKRNLSLALQESSWDDALAVLEKLVSVEESQPAYHNQIGDILLKSGRQGDAITSFMRGVHAYRELGMYGNGAALCKKVLRLEPEQREAIWVLGELKTRQGFLADGAEKMLEALRLYAEDTSVGRKALLELLEQAEALQASSRPVLEFLAATYARLDERERARRATLRLADLEEGEGHRETAEKLRLLARDFEPAAEATPAATGPTASTPPPAPEPPRPAVQLEPSSRPLALRARPEDIERLTITQPGEPMPPPAPSVGAPSAVSSDSFEAFTVSRPPTPPTAAPAPEAVEHMEPTLDVDLEPEAESESEALDLDAEAAALAATMLAQLQAATPNLPDVEVLHTQHDLEELLSTRQIADDLTSQLHGDADVEVLAEVRVPAEAAAPRSALSSPPARSAVDGEPPALELASVQESLREAEGNWETRQRAGRGLVKPPGGPSAAADQPARTAETEPRPGDRHRSIDLDQRAAEGHLSFGLSTTAGEALQTDDIDEVLGEFKRRMKEQMGSMAPEERYQLGVSYMEMGLYEEALEEFEHTLEHKVLGQKTREWMARCLLELERPREIVLLLQTRLDAETYPRKSMVELYYTLGQAYEMLKAWDLALDAFTKVYQLDSEFRDVQARLAKLTGA
jgi:tetratricopeptide (TPR) repeat protein